MPWAEKLITSKSNDTQAPEEGRVLSYMEALHEALSLALELDPKVLVLGQGVNDPKGMLESPRDSMKNLGKIECLTPLSLKKV